MRIPTALLTALALPCLCIAGQRGLSEPAGSLARELSAAPPGNGLEQLSADPGSFWKIPYSLTTNLPEEQGWVHNRIVNRIERALKADGLEPIRPLLEGIGLDIQVFVHGDRFSVDIAFLRTVYYLPGAAKELHAVSAATWETGSTGSYDGDPEYLVGAVGKAVETFANAYLISNLHK